MAILDEMLAGWRSEGYAVEDIEVWTVGYAGQEERVAGLWEERNGESIFVDAVEPEASAITAYGAHVNDLFLIDRAGCIASLMNLGVSPLSLEEHRDTLDALVRELLG